MGKHEYICINCMREYSIYKHIDKSKYFQRFIDFCNRNNYIPISTIDDYKNVYTKLKYICPHHGEQFVCIISLHDCTICPKCRYEIYSKKNKKTINDIIQLVKSKNNDILLNPYDYKGANVNNLRIICGTCGKEFVTSLSSIRNNLGKCRYCASKELAQNLKFSQGQVEQMVNSINNNILLNPQDYKNMNSRNLLIKCGNCQDNIFKTSLAEYMYRHRVRCQKCSKILTQGELIIYNFLEKESIQFVNQKRFNDCKDKKVLPFDFYLPDYNTCIEFDGQQHFEPKYGEEKFKITQYHDQIKNKYCEDNNIRLIRIPYWDGHNIEEILTKELNLNCA